MVAFIKTEKYQTLILVNRVEVFCIEPYAKLTFGLVAMLSYTSTVNTVGK